MSDSPIDVFTHLDNIEEAEREVIEAARKVASGIGSPVSPSLQPDAAMELMQALNKLSLAELAFDALAADLPIPYELTDASVSSYDQDEDRRARIAAGCPTGVHWDCAGKNRSHGSLQHPTDANGSPVIEVP